MFCSTFNLFSQLFIPLVWKRSEDKWNSWTDGQVFCSTFNLFSQLLTPLVWKRFEDKWNSWIDGQGIPSPGRSLTISFLHFQRLIIPSLGSGRSLLISFCTFNVNYWWLWSPCKYVFLHGILVDFSGSQSSVSFSPAWSISLKKNHNLWQNKRWNRFSPVLRPRLAHLVGCQGTQGQLPKYLRMDRWFKAEKSMHGLFHASRHGPAHHCLWVEAKTSSVNHGW